MGQEGGETVLLAEAKDRYPGEWIAFRIQENGENPEGEVVLHDKHRGEFDHALLAHGLTGVYITFTGPTIPEGYGTIL